MFREPARFFYLMGVNQLSHMSFRIFTNSLKVFQKFEKGTHAVSIHNKSMKLSKMSHKDKVTFSVLLLRKE